MDFVMFGRFSKEESKVEIISEHKPRNAQAVYTIFCFELFQALWLPSRYCKDITLMASKPLMCLYFLLSKEIL